MCNRFLQYLNPNLGCLSLCHTDAAKYQSEEKKENADSIPNPMTNASVTRSPQCCGLGKVGIGIPLGMSPTIGTSNRSFNPMPYDIAVPVHVEIIEHD